MDFYETVGVGELSPAKVDDYGDGIKRIRHIKSAAQGRGLFYVGETRAGYQQLWLIAVFKKASQDLPKHIMVRAKERKTIDEAKLKAELEKKR